MTTVNSLALFGGQPTIADLTVQTYNPITEKEISAAVRVLKSGVLSKFVGARGQDFYGGEKVNEFERLIEDHYQVKHAISVNSLTSGLICAVGALNISPGDEVIVPTWTMSASATCIVIWGGIPVFADIDPHTFNICPKSLKALINEKTKAIIVPSIFGRPADLNAIMQIASDYNLRVIEDVAQAPNTKLDGKFVGTFGDIGGLSFNYHKHLHCGEGGVCMTNSAELAEKMRHIRNHGEALADASYTQAQLVNNIGFNFRLGEIEAAIAIEQQKRADELVGKRREVARVLNAGLQGLKNLELPDCEAGVEHAYYVYPMSLRKNADEDLPQRDVIIDALRAEGVPGLGERYVNIHKFPMYTNKLAFGMGGYPWSHPDAREGIDYTKSRCPVAENCQNHSYFGLALCEFEAELPLLEHIVLAFHKVWSHMDSLLDHQKTQ